MKESLESCLCLSDLGLGQRKRFWRLGLEAAGVMLAGMRELSWGLRTGGGEEEPGQKAENQCVCCIAQNTQEGNTENQHTHCMEQSTEQGRAEKWGLRGQGH